jgi:hypothetical protein
VVCAIILRSSTVNQTNLHIFCISREKSTILGGKFNGGHYMNSGENHCLDSPENGLGNEFVLSQLNENDNLEISRSKLNFVAVYVFN